MKKFILFFIFFFLIIVNFNIVQAGNNNAEKINFDTVLVNAATAYSKGEFEYAAKLYRSIYDKGYSSYELLYNLGNSYYKINKIGLAILFYERALLLNPFDRDLKFNLELAKTKIVDKPQEIQQSFIPKLCDKIRNILGVKQWGIISITLFSMFFIALALFFILQNPTYKKVCFYFGIVFFICTVFAAIFTRQQYNNLKNNQYAIVMVPTVTIKSSPDDNSTNLFVVHEGTKMKIFDKINEWTEIRLSDGKTGWIKSACIEKI